MTTSIEFRRARPGDLPRILELLAAAGLTPEGVESHVQDFLLAVRDNGAIVGCAGLERYGRDGLLRSVAVDERERGAGIGAALVKRLIEEAEAEGRDDIVLLTFTAAEYFERFGFRVIERSEVPPGVQASVEFRGACPATATVMRRIRSAVRSSMVTEITGVGRDD